MKNSDTERGLEGDRDQLDVPVGPMMAYSNQEKENLGGHNRSNAKQVSKNKSIHKQ